MINMVFVKLHTRRTKNGVVVVREHFKYPTSKLKRISTGMKRDAESASLTNGKFIAKKLRNVERRLVLRKPINKQDWDLLIEPYV